jgi:hypothetical protein
MGTFLPPPKCFNSYAKALPTVFLVLISVVLQAQQTYTSVTNQTVKPVVMNFMNRVAEYNANPPAVSIEYKTAKDPLFIPPNPMPVGISANVTTLKPKISGVGNSGVNQPNESYAPPPAPSVGFTAIIDNINSIPPDVAGAVGPNHVMTTLNNGVMIQDKTGGNTTFVNDNTFFTVEETTSIYDPKILYDKYTQRYYFIDLDGANEARSNILLAVSQTNDPTGAWNQYRFKTNTGETNIWFDYPSVGYNKDWLVISGNMFGVNGSFSKVKLFVVKISDVINGLVTTPNEISFAGSGSGFTVSPAVVDDNTTDYVPLITNWNYTTGTYKLLKITGVPPAAPVLSDVGFPSVGSANAWTYAMYHQNESPQKDMTSRTNGVSSNDHRMSNAVLKNGKLWAVHPAFFSSTGTRSSAATYRGAAQWLSINPNTAAINEWGKVIDNNTTDMGGYNMPTNSFAFPSIAVNDNEDVLLNFAHFSPTQYPGASYALRTNGSASFSDVYLFKEGVEHYYKTYDGSSNRWGDYTITMVDPSNGLDFWAIGEYSETNNGTHDRWATYWAKVSVPLPNSITINSVQNDTLCVGKSYAFTFAAAGTYASGNNFQVQLSDNTGSFTSPTIIETVSGTAGSTISIAISTSISGGAGYKLRIISSNPPITSTNTTDVVVVGKDLVINGVAATPFEATEYITAQNIAISRNTKYQAGKSITLTATPSTSISTTNGTVFEAKIVGCPY